MKYFTPKNFMKFYITNYTQVHVYVVTSLSAW